MRFGSRARPTHSSQVSLPPQRVSLAFAAAIEPPPPCAASKYRPSLDMYSLSLNKNPFDAIVWSNRAAVRLKLEEHGLAIADASQSSSALPARCGLCL